MESNRTGNGEHLINIAIRGKSAKEQKCLGNNRVNKQLKYQQWQW